MSGSKAAKVDPELVRQIAQAEEEHSPVQAVISLRGRSRGRSYLSPEETIKTVKRIVGRVTEETHATPRTLNVFRNLSSFVIEADALFIKRLIDLEEVNAAMANQQHGSALKPVKPRKSASVGRTRTRPKKRRKAES